MLVRVWRVRNGRTSLILSCLIGFLNVAPAASQLEPGTGVVAAGFGADGVSVGS